MNPPVFKNKGFTLIEIMVSLAILGIAVTFIYTTFISQKNNALIQEDVSDVQQNARIAMDYLTRDIRSAGVGLTTASFVVSAGTSPTSVTIQRGASTSITDVVAWGSNFKLTVPSASGFSVGDPVFILDAANKNTNRNAGTVAIVAPLNSTAIIVGGNQPVLGDLIVNSYDILYRLSGTQLQRRVGPAAAWTTIADGILDLNVNTANASLIGVTLTTQTSKAVSKSKNAGGTLAPRQRILSSNIMIKNKNLY